MKIYLDTNIWVAALQPEHVHHPGSFAAMMRVQRGDITAHISGQGLSELYSVLSRTPFSPRIDAAEAESMIDETVLQCSTIVDVTVASYRRAIAVCAAGKWKGGRIHDAVHVQAALQSGCDAIYTYNHADLESVRGAFIGPIGAPPLH